MYSSHRLQIKHLICELSASAFLAIFGAVYELFSHGVVSYYMVFAFAVPLLLGALPNGVLLLSGKSADGVFLRLWDAAIAALSVGSVLRGVLEIYGTTNSLLGVYPLAAAALMLSALLRAALRRRES